MYGVSVYTGHQTKVMKNALKSRPKKSKIEQRMNYYIVVIVLIQFVISFTAAAYSCLWVENSGHTISYLGYQYTQDVNTQSQKYIIAFMMWFIALMNFVPISLLVTVELVKFSQGIFIEWDW